MWHLPLLRPCRLHLKKYTRMKVSPSWLEYQSNTTNDGCQRRRLIVFWMILLMLRTLITSYWNPTFSNLPQTLFEKKNTWKPKTCIFILLVVSLHIIFCVDKSRHQASSIAGRPIVCVTGFANVAHLPIFSMDMESECSMGVIVIASHSVTRHSIPPH